MSTRLRRTRLFATWITVAAVLIASSLLAAPKAAAATIFTSAAQVSFAVNQTGSFTVTTTGDGVPSINVAAPLPIGLTLVDQKDGTAVLTGAPSVTGTLSVPVVAKQAGQPDQTQTLTITVSGTPTAPTVATQTIKTPFTVGLVGLATIRAEGVPTPSLSLSGTLPEGLEFVDRHDGTGVIRGTATTATTATVTVTASNGVGSPAVQELTIAVNATSPSYNGLAQTPTLGMATWGYLRCGTNAQALMAYAKSIVDLGLRDKGYDIIQIDDCWQGGRDANGNLFAHPDRFPQGMKPVADYFHSLGLRFGMYISPGTETCAEFYDGYQPSPGQTLGSFGHERQDAELLASWEVDYVKDDWCLADHNANTTVQQAYTLQSNELVRASTVAKRPIFFAMSAYGLTEPWTWAKGIVNDWRVTDDQQNNWTGQMAGIDAAAPLAGYVGPGHWNNISDTSSGGAALSETESLALFDMAVTMSVSALLDRPAASFSPALLDHVRNEELIAVHQDPLGRVATRVANNGGLQVWARPMANGDTVVTLLNNTGSRATIGTDLAQLGVAPGEYIVRQLSARSDVATTTGPISASLPSHGAVTIRLRPGSNASLPSDGVVPGEAAPSWTASQQFTVNPWRYEYSTDNAATFAPMSYDEAAKQWNGTEAWCAVQTPSQQHPGAGVCASSRTWVAPTDGQVTIGANGPITVAASCSGNTVGVNLRVMLNSTQIWPTSGVQNVGNGQSFTFPAGVKAKVKAGDAIRFVVAHNGTVNSCDGTIWDSQVTINSTTWTASAGYLVQPWRQEFSTDQGATFRQMSYDKGKQQWVGSEPGCLVRQSSQQPGARGCLAVRSWQAPSAGTVLIGAEGPISLASHCSPGSAGVQLRVLRNSTQIWPTSGSQRVAGGSSFTFPSGVSATVAPGDVIRFVAAPTASGGCTETVWDAKVTP